MVMRRFINEPLASHSIKRLAIFYSNIFFDNSSAVQTFEAGLLFTTIIKAIFLLADDCDGNFWC